ncbi:hypothetical protein HU200_000412 [Digitaria exilis]|uniref:HTH TFE/IIEalpha-type domain-containing protein n=1 Tax=Digitaria exilis TaxID=1010633 RepID=A0A835KVN1_9POAL|nr:hypothetical protein HU200_000412 [Digitaria exilis]
MQNLLSFHLRRQWVREEDLAKALKLHSKQLRRILRFFEEEKLVTRDHRKESAKGAKMHNAAAAAAAALIVNQYSAFDALQLVSYTDEYFHCENCNGELVAESDKLVFEEMGDGDDNVRKRRCEKLKDMQQRIEEQMKPLVAQLDRVKNLPAPEFGSLQTWERANFGAFANGEPSVVDSSRNSQGQYGKDEFTGIPLLDRSYIYFAFQIEVIYGNVKESAESGNNGSELKVLPPWMIKDGMNLKKEQRGETSKAPKLDENTEAMEDKKQYSKDDQSIQEEYITAYYEALRKKQEEEEAKRRMQQEGEAFVSDSQSERQVGKKHKREDEDEGIEWEEQQPTGIFLFSFF